MRTGAHGFTIIEVLTCLAIGLALTVLATGTFFQVRSVLHRTEARLEMHNQARFIFQTMRSDLSAMQQEGALFIESTEDTPTTQPGTNIPVHTGEVRLTFLRGKLDNNDFSALDDPALLNTDLVWTQWKWRQNIQSLCTGSNARNRQWSCYTHWLVRGLDFGWPSNGNPHSFINLPQPRRSAGSQAAVTLNDNSFQSGDGNDLGDYDDLQRYVVPVTRNVSNFDLEVVLVDGTVIDASVSKSMIVPLDGVFIDGHIQNAALTQPQIKRPRLFRIRFDLTNTQYGLTQTFSFSFPAPGNLPPL
jgi:prepilin-type N-terminal cleavage/methylation domain-containing protein